MDYKQLFNEVMRGEVSEDYFVLLMEAQEDEIRREAESNGYADGRSESYREGYDEGYLEGLDTGYEQGASDHSGH